MNATLTKAQIRKLERSIRGIKSSSFRDGNFGGGFGEGFVPDGVRLWQPGDRPQRVHRAETARSGELHVWKAEPEMAVNCVGVFDLSPSMYFGTAQSEKIDIANGVAHAYASLYSRWGNQFASVAVGQDIAKQPFQGNAVVSTRLYDFLSGTTTPDGTEVQLADGLKLARLRYRKAEEAVVTTHFLSSGSKDELRKLSLKRRLTVYHLVDPWNEELPADLGEVTLVDPQTGEQRLVKLSGRRGRKIRDKYSELARVRLNETKDAVGEIRRARYVVLRTDKDWVADLMSDLKSRR